MFPMENVEAQSCLSACTIFGSKPLCVSSRCRHCCKMPLNSFVGLCERRLSTDSERWKRNILTTSVSLIWIAQKKGIGSFCARYSNFDNEHGWCFASISEAEHIFKIASQYLVGRGGPKEPVGYLGMEIG
ncbi:putative albumin I chain a [Medicago truncatula]|nr:putative albumin I chain a [Medicago truncatula]